MSTVINFKKILAKLMNTPMIVERGTDGIWTYRKWSDGTAECWGLTPSTNITTSSAFGSLYYKAVSPIATFPNGLFINPPCVTATRNETGSGFGLLSLYEVSANSFSGFVVNGLNQTVSMSFAIYAIGNWAEINPDTQSLLISSYSQKQMTKAEIQGLIEASGNQFKDNDTWIPPDLA